MNNLDNYLTQDIKQAARLTKKFWKLTDELEDRVTQGNLEGAKDAALSMVHIVNELEYMQHRKRNQDDLTRMAIQLSKGGIINAEVVWRNEQDQ